MIEVENLSFSYQNNKVLKNVSFSIEKGEYLCIIGKNGVEEIIDIKLDENEKNICCFFHFFL